MAPINPNISSVNPVVAAPAPAAPAPVVPAATAGTNPANTSTPANSTGGTQGTQGGQNTTNTTPVKGGESGQTSGAQSSGSTNPSVSVSTPDFNFSSLVGNTTPTPASTEAPGSQLNPTDTSRGDMMNAAFDKAINSAKGGDTKPLTQLVNPVVAQGDSLTEEVSERESQSHSEKDPEAEAKRVDIYGRAAQNLQTQKTLKARLSQEAALAEKAQDKQLAEFFHKQTITVKTSHNKLEQAIHKDEAAAANAGTKEKAEEFKQLTQTANKELTPAQKKQLEAKLLAARSKDSSLKEFKAGKGESLVKSKQATQAQKAALQTAKAEKKGEKQIDEFIESEELSLEDAESLVCEEREETQKPPSKEKLVDAQNKVATLLNPATREANVKAKKEQREKLELAKVAFRGATADAPNDAGEKALQQGARRVYRDTNRQAFEDVLGGKSTLTGAVFLGAENKSLAKLDGVRGQNTAASLQVSSENADKEINHQDAPKQLAALNKQKATFDDMPVLSLWQWSKRSEREPSVRDLQNDGVSTGGVAV